MSRGHNNLKGESMRRAEDPVEALRRHLEETGVDEHLSGLLADAWDALDNSDATSMAALKLGRIEDPAWDPPVLSFRIERHGGMVKGSSRGEMQQWTLDLDTCSAHVAPVGFRQRTPLRNKLDTAGIATRIVTLVNTRAEDPLLEWSKDKSSVLIRLTQAVDPDMAPKQTLEGRRRRLREALTPLLAEIDWQPTNQPGRYKVSSPSN
jgi:hypothetical protein